MITTDDIKNRFEYLNRLPLDGWVWEFIRRNRTFQGILSSIEQRAQKIELSLSDDRPNTPTGFRIEIPVRFADRLTTLEHEFGLRPNLRNKEHLDPLQFQIVGIENFTRVMAFPNPNLKYTDFTKIKPCIVGLVPAKHAVIDPAMIKEWKVGDSNLFQEQCTKLITTVLPPSSIEDTIYLGISRKAKSADIVKYIEKILGNKPRINTREAFREWKYYIIVYDLRTEKEQGENDLSLYDLAELLSPIYLADRTKKKNDQDERELESSDISRYYRKARKIIKGDFRRYLPRKLNAPSYYSVEDKYSL